MNKCLNQDPLTLQYCGKEKGHAGDHLNMHSLMRWPGEVTFEVEGL